MRERIVWRIAGRVSSVSVGEFNSKQSTDVTTDQREHISLLASNP